MLKKMLFVGAVLLVASASYATTPTGRSEIKDSNGNVISQWDVEEWDGNANIKAESFNWPIEGYKALPLCVIPVKMDVGFWVRIVGCKDAVIILKQNEIRKYSGSIELTVQCNVGVDLSVDFAKLDGMPVSKDYATVNPPHIDAPEGKITVAVGLKDVNMAGWQSNVVGTCIQVGNVTIKVKPSVLPKLVGGC